ncbi:MAG: phosphatase PAP2 family protein [Acidimicrobiales bacterium]|nr:phosphatase PAP2 family protein [Acidimicrobiales bacterium]
MTTINRPIQHRAEGRGTRRLSRALITDRLTFELAKQLSLVLAAVLLYFGVRGATQGDTATAVRNGRKVLEFEKSVALDIERWAQGMILDHHWLVTLANWIYIWGHWPVIAASLIWLHQTRRVDYLQLRNAMFISGAIGLIIFTRFAVAPPRLLNVGLQDTVTEFSNSYRILQPPSLVNKYAAVPSLHVGWNLLIGMALYRASRSAVVKTLGILSPILMTITVVVTANHYVIDAVLGAAVALIGWFAAFWLTPRLVALESRLGQIPGKLPRNQ